jgi:hypothetical protein
MQPCTVASDPVGAARAAPVVNRVGGREALVVPVRLVPQVRVELLGREQGDVRRLLCEQAQEVRSVRVCE